MIREGPNNVPTIFDLNCIMTTHGTGGTGAFCPGLRIDKNYIGNA